MQLQNWCHLSTQSVHSSRSSSYQKELTYYLWTAQKVFRGVDASVAQPICSLAKDIFRCGRNTVFTNLILIILHSLNQSLQSFTKINFPRHVKVKLYTFSIPLCETLKNQNDALFWNYVVRSQGSQFVKDIHVWTT